MFLSGIVKILRPFDGTEDGLSGGVCCAISPEETIEITLARFAGEGRGEGSHALPPHPNPLPHEDVVERECFFVGFEPTRIETPRLRGEGCLVKVPG